MRVADERAHVRGVIEWIADAQFLCRLGEAGNEFVMNRALDEDARSAETDLALIPETGADRCGDGVVEIGVGEDDVRVFAAQLQRQFLETRRGIGGDGGTSDGPAGEGD